MKMIICIVILFASTMLPQQVDTTDFFPMHTGNYWEYVDIFTGKISRRTVIGDTLMPNGKQYFIVNINGSIASLFIRVQDNKYVYRYYRGNCTDNEYLMYDFSVPDSSIWPVCLELPSEGESHLGLSGTSIEYFSIFNQSLETKVYEPVKVIGADTCWNENCTIFSREYITKGVGLTRVHVELGGDNRLVGAIINGKEYGTITSIEDVDEDSSPNVFNISVYPNPFNSSTSLTLEVPNRGNLDIKAYDILGREVTSIFQGEVLTGTHRFSFNAKYLASGTYIITALFNKSFLSQKLIYLK